MHVIFNKKARFNHITEPNRSCRTYFINLCEHKFTKTTKKTCTVSVLIQQERKRTGVEVAQHEHDIVRTGQQSTDQQRANEIGKE